MSKRDTALTCAKIAGYHDDKRTFTRLIIECRVNRQAMNEAWLVGVKAKANGMKCGCYDCNKPHQPYQPKTGEVCHCKPGVHRDNCPDCEGTGQRIDFAAIRARKS